MGPAPARIRDLTRRRAGRRGPVASAPAYAARTLTHAPRSKKERTAVTDSEQQAVTNGEQQGASGLGDGGRERRRATGGSAIAAGSERESRMERRGVAIAVGSVIFARESCP